MKSGLLDFDEAAARLLAAARAVTTVERIDTLEAGGRILAESIQSPLNVPPHDNAAMDGYAVRAADVPVAGTLLPVSQRIPAGSVGLPLAPGTAARIFTGAPIPSGCDAVVMQEHTVSLEDAVQIDEAPRPGQHIRRAGEDIAAGSLLLNAGSRLGAAHLGLLASVGLATLPVWRRLRVAVFFTGDELTPPGQPLAPGAIYNSNRYVLLPLLKQLNCVVTDLGTVRDTLADTRAALREAAQGHDLIITCGGVSIGEEDHVKAALQAEGRLDLWEIAIKPGKPLAFGQVGEAGFIGLPGNPVSAFVTLLTLVRPYLLARQGCRRTEWHGRLMEAAFDWPKPGARREFLRARLDPAGRVEIYPNQGAGVLSSCAWADGLVDLPARHAVHFGDWVRYLPFSSL